MARRSEPLGPLGRAGFGVAVTVAAVIAATLVAVALAADGAATLSPADWAAVRFTLWQAAASAALSVALAVPLARAIHRRRFPGRRALVTLMGAPFILPVIVAVFGLLAVFGRGGLVNDALALIGLPRFSIYGAGGVILAHVFLNLPLATRLVLQGWAAIPAERFRLAQSLGMDAAAIGRLLERPMLREVLPGAALVIFIVCTTSFAVALTLGGGPKATTVELAIYQALRFDFDLGGAALLGLLQLAIAGAAAALALGISMPGGFGAGLDRPAPQGLAPGGLRRAIDAALILAGAVFLAGPIGMVAVDGAAQIATLPDVVWYATFRSLAVATASTALTVAGSLAIAVAVARSPGRGGRLVEGTALLAVAASPLVLGTGLFILINPVADPGRLALPVTALVNALMSLPFAVRAMVPAVVAAESAFGPLSRSLGLGPLRRLTLVTLPRVRGPMFFAAALAAALSLGDLGVIALFAPPDGATLPLQVYRLMGAYRMDDAAGAACLLLVLTLAVFWLLEKGGRLDADT